MEIGHADNADASNADLIKYQEKIRVNLRCLHLRHPRAIVSRHLCAIIPRYPRSNVPKPVLTSRSTNQKTTATDSTLYPPTT